MGRTHHRPASQLRGPIGHSTARKQPRRKRTGAHRCGHPDVLYRNTLYRDKKLGASDVTVNKGPGGDAIV